ncbi:MAG: thioesterase family protein [Nitrososphaerota archaeon]
MGEFKHKIRVSWFETDAAGVVHFSNYYKFFERAEMEFWRSLEIDYKKIMKEYNIWLPRVEASCKFISPCYFDDELEIRLTIGGLARKSIRYNFQVWNLSTAKLAAEGHMTVVSVSKDTNRSVAIPSGIADSLKDFI